MSRGSMAKKTKHFTGSIAALDIGSTKVACFIARLEADGTIRVTGIGHQLSKGIRCGHIVDIGEAETSVATAVHAAEQMADETIDNVVVNLAGVGLSSRSVSVELTASGESFTERDLAEIVTEGRASVENDDTEILHCFPVQYALDEVKNIADPRGM